jgi:hypothetical protein
VQRLALPVAGCWALVRERREQVLLEQQVLVLVLLGPVPHPQGPLAQELPERAREQPQRRPAPHNQGACSVPWLAMALRPGST